MLNFEGRTAVITGAGGGLGRHYALLLAARGAQVVVNDLGGSVNGDGAASGAAQAVVDEIMAQRGTAVADTHSVATPEGGEAIVQTALDAFGSVDILVNNAGILRDKAFHKMTPAELNPVLDVHVKGAFYVTFAAWRVMRAARYGRVINTSSNSGIIGNFGQSNYGAAKTALVGLTRVLSIEGAHHGIRVNAVAPAALTRMTESVVTDEIAAALDPAEVAPVVAFLAHESCDVSGEVFTAGGGRVARFFTGMTRGYFSADLTPELVSEHLDAIRDTSGFTVPLSPNEEIEQLLALRGADA